MPIYQHPGVYLEEIPSGVRPIEGVATSVVAFVGAATRGPVGEPTRVSSFEQYADKFGELREDFGANGIPNIRMGLAVSAFYQNGGKDAYILRLVSQQKSSVSASLNLKLFAAQPVLQIAAVNVGEWGTQLYVRVDADKVDASRFSISVGHLQPRDAVLAFKADEMYTNLSMDPHDVRYAIAAVNTSKRVKLALTADASSAFCVGLLKGASLEGCEKGYFKNSLNSLESLSVNVDGLGSKIFGINLNDSLKGADLKADAKTLASLVEAEVRKVSPLQEPYKSFTCSYDEAESCFVFTSQKSQVASVDVYCNRRQPKSLAMIMARDPDKVTRSYGWSNLTPEAMERPMNLAGGTADMPEKEDYVAGLARLERVRDVSVLLLPGQSLPHNEIVDCAVDHCENRTRNRVVIVDPPQATELTDADSVNSIAATTSNYAALYYPWTNVLSPVYDAEKDPIEQRTVAVAPSGLAAGLWSRIDGRRGVWKAPAGVEASVLGIASLAYDVSDSCQDVLNPMGVNCLRVLPGFGPVIWGARTLGTRANPEWRYVPVRRTAIMIEESIYNGIQWAVFEPNDHRLWSSLRTNIGSFMDGLFRAGAFQGEKASDAYFVRCGLGDTMVQADIDRGQVIAVVGFAPLKPAEFVIVRIQQKVQQ